MNWEVEIDTYTTDTVYKTVNKENLLYYTRNSTQRSVVI